MSASSSFSDASIEQAVRRAANVATAWTPAEHVGLIRRLEKKYQFLAGLNVESPGAVVRGEEPLLEGEHAKVVSSISEEAPTLSRWWSDVASCAVIPLASGGEDLLFVVASPEPGAFDQASLAPLEQLVGLVEEAVASAESEWGRSRHYDFLENVPVGVYRSTPDGRILYANAPLADIFGVESVDDLKNMDLNDAGVAQANRSAFKERVEREGTIVQNETTWTRVDGDTVHVLESARVVRDRHGDVKYYEGIVEDISERKRAEKELRTQKNFIDSALNSLPGAFYLIDREGRFRRWNRQLEDVAGYSPTELETLNPLELIADADRERVAHRIRQVFEEGEASAEAMVETKDGEQIPFYLTGARAEIGGALYLVGMGIDISERVAAEQAMKEAKREAEEMDRLKSVFLANMSHEIRTPLTSILGFTDILEEELEGDDHRVVNMIRESGRRLQETLTSVLELVRLERDSASVESTRSDLVERVEETVELMRPQVASTALDLELDVPSDPVYLQADPRILHRILANLLSNAIKFTEEGVVRVTVERTDEMAVMRVSDTGIGIQDDVLDRIFREFRQESEGLRREHEGSGLGLTITKRLVELMGGEIEATSTKGEGSTFTVKLPRETPEAESVHTASAET